MFQSFIILFRETLEAALIIGIVLGTLKRSGQSSHKRIVYLGVLTGILFSIAGAVVFNVVAGGFSGRSEELFEGITMLAGAALLTTMILWMIQRGKAVTEIEQRVAAELTKSRQYGLFFLVFISVLREGIEAVIFLGAANFVSESNNLWGALVGIGAAVLLSYLLLIGTVRLNLKAFFTITNVLLILFAAGLVAHGVHELQEAGWIPIVAEHVFDINPPLNDQGLFPLFHENGYLGSIAKGLFGYNGNPNLLELITYGLYLAAVFVVWAAIGKSKVHPQAV